MQAKQLSRIVKLKNPGHDFLTYIANIVTLLLQFWKIICTLEAPGGGCYGTVTLNSWPTIQTLLLSMSIN